MNTDSVYTQMPQIFTEEEHFDFDTENKIIFFELNKARFTEIFGISSSVLPDKVECSLTVEFQKNSTFAVLEVFTSQKIHLLIKFNDENLPEKVEPFYQWLTKRE